MRNVQAALRVSVPWFGLLLITDASVPAQEPPELTSGFVDVDGTRRHYEADGRIPLDFALERPGRVRRMVLEAERQLPVRPDPHTELPRIARALLEAVAIGDRPVWDRHLAHDGVFTDERGVRRSKAELLDVLQPLPEGYEGRLEPRDVEVRDFGAAAVITFRAEERLTLYGQTVTDTYFETDTYLLRDGRWQMVASHVQARIADPFAIEVTEAAIDRCAGVYQLAPDVRLTLRADDGQLIMERDGRPPQRLLPETKQIFFTPGGWDARWIFTPDADGRVSRMVARRRGEDLIWTRVN